MERTALILVGPVLASEDFRAQRALRRRLPAPLPHAGLAGRRSDDDAEWLSLGAQARERRARHDQRPSGRRRRSRAPAGAGQRLGGGAPRPPRRPRRAHVEARPRALAHSTSLAALALCISRAQGLVRRRPRAPARPASRDRRSPRRECRSSSPCPSFVILAKPPRDRDPSARDGGGYISACRPRNRPCRSARPRPARAAPAPPPPTSSPVAPATWSSPMARATSTPRWMVWIHAAQE